MNFNIFSTDAIEDITHQKWGSDFEFKAAVCQYLHWSCFEA